MKGVLISGYYGFNNTGDEAMIETLSIELAKKNYRLVVLSSNPDRTKELYNVEAYDRYNFWSIVKAIKNTDILVCTTILESGIDIPNANTIIIENADKLGLAQLYQIRGRVGRSNRLAYAYVTYNKGSVLTEEASKRLGAIKDYSEFGSGFKIALRDLEIRGAGNILGAEQHGHMMMVGYDMYAALLNKAVEKEKLKIDSVQTIDKTEIKIMLDISANIPNEYISDAVIKIEMYQKLSNATNDNEIQNVIEELIDRFGDIPEETLNLIEIVRIRNKCKIIGIDEVKIASDFVWFISKPKNHIKYRLTNDIKSDILSFVNNTLDSIIRDII